MRTSPYVLKAFEQMTALRGGEYNTDYVMDWIGAGDNDRVQKWSGVFQQKHLRYAVMTGRLNVASIRTIVSHGCDPSDAFDFCISPRMVRILVSLGGNPSTLSFFKDYMSFVNEDNKISLHEDGEERFREHGKILPAFRERILRGAIFPEPVAAWFDDNVLYSFGLREELSTKQFRFKLEYERAVKARGGVFSYYKMFRECSRNDKFLPVKVYFNRHFKSLSQRVCGMDSGVSTGISIVAKPRNPRVANLASCLRDLVDVESADITKEVLSFL